MLHLVLPAEPRSVPAAREALSVIRGAVGEDVWPDLRLLVSEVVTNAVRHAGTAPGARVRLDVLPTDGGVRIEVHDEGVGFAAARHPQPDEGGGSGWGLYFVERVARSWGTERAPDAHVWFELSTS